MTLNYAPGAFSLASRISLHEAGLAADFERVAERRTVRRALAEEAPAEAALA